MAMGIILPATRTEVLKQLVTHFIWFKNCSVEETIAVLTEWAMNPRHASKDIAADLAKGTTVVANHIRNMASWYASHREEKEHDPEPTAFARKELDTLRQSLANLTKEDRLTQAHFLLHFLRFAKRHGTPTDDGAGWEVAPAIRQVIRAWPGCSHMKYRSRIDHAVSHGLLTLVKGAWHHAHGPGRARTYCLKVPVSPESDLTLDYETAFALLTKVEESSAETNSVSLVAKEPSYAKYDARFTTDGSSSGCREALPPTLRSAGAGERMDPDSRQCQSQPHETIRVPNTVDGNIGGESGIVFGIGWFLCNQ